MILVTGATGGLGGHVVRALRRLGQPVRALVRRGSTYFWLNDTGCSYFFADLRDRRSLLRACAGIRTIVACSGIDHETRDNDHQKLTVDGHANLWSAAREKGVFRAVYVSAMGVDRDYPVPWFDAKRQAELSLAASGLEWTVLRPAPMTRAFAALATRARAGSAIAWGPGQNRVSPISPRDLALIAVGALDLPEVRGRAIEVGGPTVLTAREALDRASAEAGGGHVRTVPTAVARVSARLARSAGRRWEHRIAQQSRWFTDDFVVDAAPIEDLFGLTLTPFDTAVAEDCAQLAALADPRARDERVVHLKFDATVYEAGRAPLADLPSGPLRYDE